ncbi:MAG: DUF2029 domain-containing protein [Saprospirales bacterium]|nr:DUF2029 domain-containing protein [Saprospirales bacterium]MBK8920176.1 DUF2029 domain-containing protein [Saprospirales bacterium]
MRQDRILWLVYFLAALAVSLQKIHAGMNAQGYTAYENYIIFKNAFPHLIAGLNPYAFYMAEQWDLYKYSPAFALAMAPFAALPDWLGLQLWNLLNALPLLWAALRLPLPPAKRRFLAWFILPELVISMQNSQSNGLTAALILLAWVALEEQKPVRSAGWAAGGGFLKIFGILAVAPALVYPQRRVFLPALVLWSLLLFGIPLLVLTPGQAWQIYIWWLELLQNDHSASVGLSVRGWLQSWFGWEAPKPGVAAFSLLALALSTWSVYRQTNRQSGLPPLQNRVLLWAALLVWVVIFNHKAESPTFVIAMSGVGLWYLNREKPPFWMKFLLWTAFAFASLSPTDLFPRLWREQIVQPYVLKAVPCILIWLIATIQLLRPLVQKQQLTSDE